MYIPKQFKFKIVKGRNRCLYANKLFKKGEVVIQMRGEIEECHGDSDPDSLQVDDNKFLNSKYRKLCDNINHSCNANTKIDVENLTLIATRDIEKGEEITFNYNTTDYDLVCENQQFECHCESKNCIGVIKGFKYLTKSQKLKLKPYLLPYLKKKLKK